MQDIELHRVGPCNMTRDFLNRPEIIQPKKRQHNCNMSGVHLHVRCNNPCRKPRVRNQKLPPTSFTTPSCLCPCHFTVGHAAFFLRVTGQRQWSLENTRNFLLSERKKNVLQQTATEWAMEVQLSNERVYRKRRDSAKASLKNLIRWIRIQSHNS